MKRNFVILLILAIACGKNSTQNSIVVPNLIQAENKRANISGQVLLYDEEGSALPDNSGVKISIDNSTISTTTKADGKWQLDSIPFGTYDISYSKEGFGTGKIMGIYHAATNHSTTVIAKSESMAVNSSIEITNLVVTPFKPGFEQLGVSGVHIDPVFTNTSGKDKYVRLFFSDNNSVSATSFLAETKVRSNGAPLQQNNYNLTTSWFESLGFKKGQTIYVKAYGDSFLADQYTDPLTNTTIFPSLSTKPSNAVSFILK
jgi:hypothetical protein